MLVVMKHRARLYPELLLLFVLAILSRSWQLFKPNSVVFDEVYFKAFAGNYLDGRYFFDIHPPFGKLVLAGWAYICGLSGQVLANTTALPLRVVPAVFGILLIPIVWGIIRKLGGSRKAAFLGGFIILLDNTLLVESRFILTDTILLATGLGAIYTYLHIRKSSGPKYYAGLVLSVLLAAMSFSTKWTGLTALALICIMWAYDSRKNLLSRSGIGQLLILGLVPFFFYFSLFAIHFKLLPASGEGDAFMSTRFQSTLVDNSNYNPETKMALPEKFIELNVAMFQANKTLTASHPYGSHWYSWPLELRPIYYWQGETLANGKQGNIYLLGNPMIWWGCFAALLSGLIFFISRKSLRKKGSTKIVILLLIAYLMNYLPFVAVTRVMFLYHYFFSLIFSIILAVLLWDFMSSKLSQDDSKKKLLSGLYIGIIVVICLAFIYFAPLSYGIPLSPTELQDRIWLQSWR